VKKLTILNILFLSLYPFLVQPQLVNNYGIKLGITSTDLSYENFPFTIESQRKLGFIGGVFVEWFNNPIFSMITEIEYSQKGAGYEITGTGADSPEPIGTKTYYDKLDYLSFPIYAKIKIPASVAVTYLFIGPRIDFLLGYSSEFNGNIFSKFKSTTLGGIVGLGIHPLLEIPLNPFLELRYNIDFTNSYDENGMTINNNAFNILLGVTFN